jgi:beta-lactamase class A
MIATVVQDLDDIFEQAGCTGALHVLRLSDDAEVALRDRELWVAASVIKVPIALEFYAQVEEGRVDPSRRITVGQGKTPGPTGISLSLDPVTMSLRDLCTAMLTISDNAATDTVLAAVGEAAVNERLERLGCFETVLAESILDLIATMARDLGFADYATLVKAQEGQLGAEALAASTDQDRISASRVLDPARTNRTTARDATRLLAAVWRDRVTPPAACAQLRRAMSHQLTRRLSVAVPAGGSLAAKSGSLFGRIRNEVGVIGAPGGEFYAVAVFTRIHQPFVAVPAVDQAMAVAVRTAIEQL